MRGGGMGPSRSRRPACRAERLKEHPRSKQHPIIPQGRGTPRHRWGGPRRPVMFKRRRTIDLHERLSALEDRIDAYEDGLPNALTGREVVERKGGVATDPRLRRPGTDEGA